MKLLLYAMLVVFLVPLQATLLPHLAIWDVRPDLGLVVARPHRSISRRIGWIARGFGHWVGAKFVFCGRSLVESAHDRGRRVVWGSWQGMWLR